MAPTTAEAPSRRGQVEASVKRLTDLYVEDKIHTPDDRPLTAYVAAKMIQKLERLEDLPSSGSISAVFDRWKELGFAKFSSSPYAFVDYTAKGRELGLAELKNRAAARKRRQRQS